MFGLYVIDQNAVEETQKQTEIVVRKKCKITVALCASGLLRVCVSRYVSRLTIQIQISNLHLRITHTGIILNHPARRAEIPLLS